MQLLVLGMHRSGTSAVTGVLERMGFYIGGPQDQHPITEDNPKGYFERVDVFDLHEILLQSMDSSWYDIVGASIGRAPLPALEKATAAAQQVVDKLDQHRPWALKDPRLGLLLDLWLPLLDQPTCLIVTRDPRAVARSLERRNGFPKVFGLALWQEYTRRALAASKNLPRIFVSYEQLLDDPTTVTRDLKLALENRGAENLSMPSREQLSEFVDRSLVRALPVEGNHLEPFRPEDEALHRFLLAAANGDTLPELAALPEERSIDDAAVLALASGLHKVIRRDTSVLLEDYRRLEAAHVALLAKHTN